MYYVHYIIFFLGPMPMLMFMLMFMLMIMLIGYACANGNVSAYVFIVFLMCIQSFFMRER